MRISDWSSDVCSSDLRTCLSADPENVEALRLLAGVAASTGYSTDAEKLLRRAVESAPAFILAYADLASLLCRLNRAEAAIPLLDAVLEDPSRRLWALSLKTTILTGQRRVAEPLNVTEQLVARAPGAAVPWTNNDKAPKTS